MQPTEALNQVPQRLSTGSSPPRLPSRQSSPPRLSIFKQFTEAVGLQTVQREFQSQPIEASDHSPYRLYIAVHRVSRSQSTETRQTSPPRPSLLSQCYIEMALYRSEVSGLKSHRFGTSLSDKTVCGAQDAPHFDNPVLRAHRLRVPGYFTVAGTFGIQRKTVLSASSSLHEPAGVWRISPLLQE